MPLKPALPTSPAPPPPPPAAQLQSHLLLPEPPEYPLAVADIPAIILSEAVPPAAPDEQEPPPPPPDPPGDPPPLIELPAPPPFAKKMFWPTVDVVDMLVEDPDSCSPPPGQWL